MAIGFKSRTLPHITTRINRTIKKSIDSYRKWQVPMSLFLTNFLAVKTKGADYSAENPWKCLTKDVAGRKFESGVSVDEAAFRFASLELMYELPSDVINAAFYSNKSRNDSDFEIGYLLTGFNQIISKDDMVLIVNPSPTMVCAFESSSTACKKKMYAVPDETVAKLYKIQFPSSDFFSFEQIQQIRGVDALLLVNRDQKISASGMLLNSLSCCNDSAKVLGLIPNAWFDSTRTGAYQILNNTGFSIKQALLLDSSATNSTPRKKMLVVMQKSEKSTIAVQRSSFDAKTNTFIVPDKVTHIDEQDYLESDKTIESCRVKQESQKDTDSEPVYNKAEEYRFSNEISLFYKIYSGRKNKYAGVAYYKEIKSIEPKRWGKKLTPDIEKGLRADTRESVISAIEGIVFDDKVYSYIRSDIEKNYIGQGPISLKTLWFYCWSLISSAQNYDHDFMCHLFTSSDASEIISQTCSGNEIINAMSRTLGVDPSDVPFYRLEQVYSFIQTALKFKIIPFNPLESYMAEYSRRASERQQDVRNALVKKHFSDKEEQSIFVGIIGRQSLKKHLCTEKSLLLASAIRLFTGISIREVAALKWSDYKLIQGTDAYQIYITKFVDQKGNIQQHSEKQNWKRFRIVPCATVLSSLLLVRKQYLMDLGIDKEYLADCPIVLGEERISDMKNRKRIPHCRPSVISNSSNGLINMAGIPENSVVLPDERNDLTTDFNRYHGDIFQTNFRDKANHSAFMTNGEINYVLGVDAPDTFSRYYCDYTNDFIQLGMIQKLCRWELGYERMIMKMPISTPSFGVQSGDIHFETGPYKNGVASVDLIISNDSDSETEVIIRSIHGSKVNHTIYGENDGKHTH